MNKIDNRLHDIQAILDCPLPKPYGQPVRSEPRKDNAKRIRELFKQLGLKGLRVITPTYSMASTIEIYHPSIRDVNQIKYGDDWQGFTNDPHSDRRIVRKLTAVILARFPDLDDRSDRMSDYHDNPLSFLALEVPCSTQS